MEQQRERKRELDSVTGRVLQLESLTELDSVRMSVPDLERKMEIWSERQTESQSANQ